MLHLFDDDPRAKSDPEYSVKHGSFGAVAINMNKALKELGYYAEADDALWVGKCGSLEPAFRYKDKKHFYINVWECSNTLPIFLLHHAKAVNQRVFGLCDKTTNIWRKYGFEAETIYGGCDTEFWRPTIEKNKQQFTFCHVNHATVRTGLELTLQAFDKAFRGNKDVKLIIKDTGEPNQLLEQYINSFVELGNNIQYIRDFWTTLQVRDLYSFSHVTINLLRSTSFGMPLLECSACRSLCLTGNAPPTNELVDDSFAVLVPRNKPVEVFPLILELEAKYGLKNYYGNFSYPEMPMFEDFDIDVYSDKMKEIYLNWGSKYSQIDTRTPIIQRWKWTNSAAKLVNCLLNK